jgi:hypothetical protein
MCAEGAKMILGGGHNFLGGFGVEKLHFCKTLIFRYGNSDVFPLAKYASFRLALILC